MYIKSCSLLLSCQEIHPVGTSPAVQWLKLHASTAGDVGSIPGRGSSTCCCEVWPTPPNNNNNKNLTLPCLPDLRREVMVIRQLIPLGRDLSRASANRGRQEGSAFRKAQGRTDGLPGGLFVTPEQSLVAYCCCAFG